MSLGSGELPSEGRMERGPRTQGEPSSVSFLYPPTPIISSVLSPLPHKPSGSWSARSWHPLVGHEDTEGFSEAWHLVTTGSRVREKGLGTGSGPTVVTRERIGSHMPVYTVRDCSRF